MTDKDKAESVFTGRESAGSAPAAAPGCHAMGERLLLSTGEAKAVEDITKDDMLMGDDGKPRNILRIIRGAGSLYRIIPVKGKPFTVDENHMLALKKSGANGKIVDVSVKEYLSWDPAKRKRFKLMRSHGTPRFDRADEVYPIPPHALGVLLGDGSLSQRQVSVTTMDSEIYEELHRLATSYKLKLREAPAGRAKTYFFTSGVHGAPTNGIKKELMRLGLCGETSGTKFVPDCYKYGDMNARLDVIAGLLDSDGSLTHNCYDFISKSRQLSEDLAFMCHSVGLAAYVMETQKGYDDGKGGFKATYWRVSISGDCDRLPMQVPHKMAQPRRQTKDALVTGFAVEPAGRGACVGFAVDGDSRYLLDDFTIIRDCDVDRGPWPVACLHGA